MRRVCGNIDSQILVAVSLERHKNAQVAARVTQIKAALVQFLWHTRLHCRLEMNCITSHASMSEQHSYLCHRSGARVALDTCTLHTSALVRFLHEHG